MIKKSWIFYRNEMPTIPESFHVDLDNHHKWASDHDELKQYDLFDLWELHNLVVLLLSSTC